LKQLDVNTQAAAHKGQVVIKARDLLIDFSRRCIALPLEEIQEHFAF